MMRRLLRAFLHSNAGRATVVALDFGLWLMAAFAEGVLTFNWRDLTWQDGVGLVALVFDGLLWPVGIAAIAQLIHGGYEGFDRWVDSIMHEPEPRPTLAPVVRLRPRPADVKRVA